LAALHPRWFLHSVRGRLTLLVVALLAPALLLVATLMYRAHQNERVAISEKLLATARAVSGLADRELKEFDAILRTLGASQALASGELDRFESIARAAFPDGSRWHVLSSPERVQILNTFLPPGVPVPAHKTELPELSAALERGERYISNLHDARAAQAPIVFVSRPYLHDGRLRYILTLATRSADLSETLGLSHYATPEGLVALVDRERRIIARSRAPDKFVGRSTSPYMRSLIDQGPEGVHDTVTLDGIASITAFHRSEVSGWVAVVSAPKSGLFASLRTLLWAGLALSAVLLATASIFAVWIMRGLTRGIDSLVAGSEAILRDEPVNFVSTGLRETDFVGSAMTRSAHHLRDTSEQLQSTLAELEKRVAERTQRLSETVGELEAFSYSISHDMRAPLRAMHSYAQLLQTEHAASLDPEARRYLERINVNAARLELLVRDVLAYSRVAKEQIVTTRVDLDRYVRDLVTQLPDSAHPGVVEVIGSLPPALAHEAYLSQILTNLVGNAFKFVSPGVAPRVTLSAETEGAFVKVSVRDNGIGIDPADFGRIFDIFGRVHPSGSYEGTGIGLSIVKKAVQRMGGELGVFSTPGAGSTFWFTLPRA
jgi:signal transduction histidine kinase